MRLDYDVFARLNPEWPANASALQGRFVRLHFKMENAGGGAFVRGTVLRVHAVAEDGRDEPVLDLIRIAPHEVHPALYSVTPMFVQLEPVGYQPCCSCEGLGCVHECNPSGSHPPVVVTCPDCKGSKQGRRASDRRA